MLTFHLALLMVIISSIFPEVVLREFFQVMVPTWLPYLKVIVLLVLAAALQRSKEQYRSLSGFAVVLAGFVALHEVTAMFLRSSWWQGLFAESGWFIGSVGSQVSLKLPSTVPVIALLLVLYKKPDQLYLVKGDLSVVAEPIPAFGIKPRWVKWGRLAVISGFAIAAGTLLLTLITVTGFSAPDNLGALPGALPFIFLFALINSFSEGVFFRNAVLGPLTGVLPKGQLMIVAAVFFGVSHYYGAPQGIIGVVMSGVLGWYLCRSMYETRGMLAPWIIHFLQDVVIFAAMVALTVA